MSVADQASAETHRQCALSRERRPVTELIRFVLDPEDRVVPDIRRNLPGRGVWLLARAEVVAEAVRRSVFGRAFRKAIKVGATLPDEVDALLSKAALADLGFANKAGQLVLGFAKIEGLARGPKVIGLVRASDAAPGGGEKLAARHSAGRDEAKLDLPVVKGFEVAELSLALGRANVVHAALIEGGASKKFLISAARLEAYRARDAAAAVSEGRGLGEV